jgi:adrenodoxin-NADP+ reductase
MPGFADLGIPFDERRGIIPNDMDGRVLADSQGRHGAHIPGIYTAGWAKRGPTGVIASTMNDAFLTAEAIAQDREQGAVFLNGDRANALGSTSLGWEGVADEARSRGLRRVSWRDWKAIDEAEKERGRKAGKVREKFQSVGEMLRVLDGDSHVGSPA